MKILPPQWAPGVRDFSFPYIKIVFFYEFYIQVFNFIAVLLGETPFNMIR